MDIEATFQMQHYVKGASESDPGMCVEQNGQVVELYVLSISELCDLDMPHTLTTIPESESSGKWVR